MTRIWWMHYAYNLENGKRCVLGFYFSENPPHERTPFIYSHPVRTKWVRATDVDVISHESALTFRINRNGDVS